MDVLLKDALGRDASELAAEERQRLLSRLLSRLAHEIRNPLSALDVHVQLLEEDLVRVSPPVSPDLTGRLEIVRSELRRLDEIVRQFLSLAAPAPVHLQALDIADVLHPVARLLAPAAHERQVALAVHVPANLPVIEGDAGQLKQALVNLVLNGIQAVDQAGQVTMTARCDDLRRMLEIEVSDTGPGIDPGKHLAIFEPFFTTKPEGSGLGLWIVQQIAMAHGGSVAATNAGTGGAVFTLCLPLPPAARSP